VHSKNYEPRFASTFWNGGSISQWRKSRSYVVLDEVGICSCPRWPWYLKWRWLTGWQLLPCFASGAGCFDDSLPDWDGAPVISKQFSAHTTPTYSAGARCSQAMPCSASAFWRKKCCTRSAATLKAESLHWAMFDGIWYVHVSQRKQDELMHVVSKKQVNVDMQGSLLTHAACIRTLTPLKVGTSKLG
jgi:hypothetical protein